MAMDVVIRFDVTKLSFPQICSDKQSVNINNGVNPIQGYTPTALSIDVFNPSYRFYVADCPKVTLRGREIDRGRISDY